ncbi:hypothetical protein TSUD_337110 [Trifolium subterraneum]|uniref:RING-type E3 ubiquitin transferase n=1 Tax=Trifolium subterraneum TaxID=3900 RepID=A0A2Z6NUX8_TRISU|nr:hypothetical protein TSUD_337110 [Trifolium subterraneum]
MGHRHLYNASSPMFEGEADQNWNQMHTDQHHVNHGGTSSSENGSFNYPVENISIDNIYFPSHWNTNTRSSGYASSGLNIEVPPPPPHQLDTQGTSNNHFMHSSSAGPFFTVSENYVHQPSSSNYDRQAFHVDNGFVDLTMGSGRGHHKRKSPGIPSVYERGSSSGYFNAGSSTDLPMPSESRPEKPNMDSQYMPWDHVAMTPTFRGAGLSMKGESSVRNVRSRSAFDLESNLSRTHLSSNLSHNSYPNVPPVGHSSLADLSAQVSTSLTRDWSQMNVTPATSTFGLETSHFPVGNAAAAAAASNATLDVGSFHHEYGTSRNPTTAQSFQNLTQTARGTRSNYSQRSAPAYRASSSLRLGHAPSDNNGLPMVAESHPSRHPRPLTTIGWRNSDRNGRSRISSERYRALADEASLHARFASEELLALGERIGQVNTGLSEDVVSKCLTETIYCSSDQCQDEGSCVICLEEYKNMDDVGTLKTCGHDYHVSCIKKWLSMKKLCPICKASALPEDKKDK